MIFLYKKQQVKQNKKIRLMNKYLLNYFQVKKKLKNKLKINKKLLNKKIVNKNNNHR